MDSKVFLVGASFLDCEGEASVLAIPFSKSVQGAIQDRLKKQFDQFMSLEPVEYDGRYKADEDECLEIKDYEDPDHTIERFLEYCNALASGDLSSSDDMEKCKALLICLPGLTRYVLIQRFYKGLLASKSRFFQIFGKTTYSNIASTAFSFASSVTGVYDTEERSLRFRSIQSIRGALPRFDEVYAPGATEQMMQSFFGHPMFERSSALSVINKDSTKLSRLVWLIKNENIDIENGIKNFARIDELLNMQCYKDGLIHFPTDVKRNQIILRTILGDVFESDGKVYWMNSKKALLPFDT